jgi:hypothetical protein
MTAGENWLACSKKRYERGTSLHQDNLTEQRLTGASLLVFKNKSDVGGAMTEDEVREVCGRRIA